MEFREMDGKHKWMKSALYMGTIVRVQVATAAPVNAVDAAMNEVFSIFRSVEQICSRFDKQSELSALCRTVGTPVETSEVLFQALHFAIEVARATDGRFDPTIGRALEEIGFNRHYLTGEVVASHQADGDVTYRDIVLDPENQTVMLERKMQIDLGAVAKGLAVDLAVNALGSFEGFVVNAGGDLYAGGVNEQDEPWTIEIQHPVEKDKCICSLQVTNQAVCTSGSYERVSPIEAGTHHIIHPQTKVSAKGVVSCTAVGPFTMLADAFSTAGFLYGWKAGLELLEDVGLTGLFITDDLEFHMSDDMKRYLHG